MISKMTMKCRVGVFAIGTGVGVAAGDEADMDCVAPTPARRKPERNMAIPGSPLREGGLAGARVLWSQACRSLKILENMKTKLMFIAKPASLLIGLVLACASAVAEGGKHGLSAFGELKYPADFKHFDWVNPDAPKGGRLATIGTARARNFRQLQCFILKGDAAQGLDYVFDTLMARAYDEPDAVYGLVARIGRAGA